jgi:molybdate transport system substrate-binding protein
VPPSPRFFRIFRWLLAAVAAAPGLAQAQDVTVAVAANFAAPMRQIAAAFERETRHRVVVAIGSTGSLYAQIRHGAPFHVLLAADAVTPQRLEQEALAVTGSRRTYAVGRLALWSATPGLVDDQGQVLRSGRFERIAIANPRLAPYGLAATQVMERLGVHAALRAKWVQGESVGQVHQFVASGNATLGFVALAQIQVDGQISQGSAWVIPTEWHDPIRQDAALLMPGRDHAGARAFLAYLRSGPAQAIIRAHGYLIPSP